MLSDVLLTDWFLSTEDLQYKLQLKRASQKDIQLEDTKQWRVSW